MNTPRKNAVAVIAHQIEAETGRKLATSYIVGKLQKSADGGYFVEYRGQKFGGEICLPTGAGEIVNVMNN